MSLDHILLGLLRTPASGYDLKKEFESSAAHFWSAHLSQIYPTLKRMEEQGWLTSTTVPSDRGPDRRVYELTPEGRKELESWLRQQPRLDDPRLPHIAQLYFLGELDDPDTSLRIARGIRRRYQERLRALEAVEQEWADSDPDYPDELGVEDFHKLLALHAGIRVGRARVAWSDEMLERMEERWGAESGDDSPSSPGRPPERDRTSDDSRAAGARHDHDSAPGATP